MKTVKAQFPSWCKSLSVFLCVQIVIAVVALIHLDLRARHFERDHKFHFDEAGQIPAKRDYYIAVRREIAAIARTNESMLAIVNNHGFEVRSLPGSGRTTFTLVLQGLNK